MPAGLTLRRFRAALFDVDGTLIDSLDMLASGLEDSFERFAGVRPSRAEVLGMIGMPLRTQLLRYRETPPTDAELGEMIAWTVARFKAYEHLEREFAPAVEALRALKRSGFGIALVTSKNSEELAGFLTRFSASDAVDVAVCSSDVLRPKPYPDSALLACERLGVAPADAIFVGDSIFDMRCARDAGATPLAVGYGAAPTEILDSEGPAGIFPTPESFLEWVESSLLTPSCPEGK